jgi:hypothetical protein
VFLQDGGSVRILLDVFGVAARQPAVHIHEVGECDAPSFESAGAHFNPDKKQHGTGSSRGPHAGDLPNIFVEATGKGHLEFTAKRVTLKKGHTPCSAARGPHWSCTPKPMTCARTRTATAGVAWRAGSSSALNRRRVPAAQPRADVECAAIRGCAASRGLRAWYRRGRQR